MAEERISSFIGPEAFAELERAKDSVKDLVRSVVDGAKASREAQFNLSGAKDLKEVVTAQNAIVDTNGKLVSSTQDAAKALVDYIRLKQQYNGSTKEIVAGTQQYAKALEQEAKAHLAANKAEVEAEKLRTQAAKTTNELAKAENQKAQANRANTSSTIQQNRELERLIAAEERATLAAQSSAAKTANNIVAPDSVKALAKTLRELQEGYDRLTQSERDNEHIGGVLLARIQELDRAVKSAKESTGRHQDSVGDYAKGLSGLGKVTDGVKRASDNFSRSLGQISGEFTNIAYGAKTFISSLSNNIGPAFESARTLILQLKELRVQTAANAEAAGQQAKETALAGGATEEAAEKLGELAKEQVLAAAAADRGTSVLGALGKSLFSFTTLIGLAVAAVTIFGPRLIDLIFGASESKKALDALNDSFKKIDEQIRKSAAQEIVALRTLNTVATDTKARIEDRRAAAMRMQELYPTILGNLTQEAILEGRAKAAIQETTAALIAKARATSAQRKLEDLADRDLELSIKQAKAAKEYGAAVIAYGEARAAASETDEGFFNAVGQKGRVENTAKLYKDIRKEREALGREQAIYTRFIAQGSEQSKGLFQGGTAAPGSVEDLRNRISLLKTFIDRQQVGSEIQKQKTKELIALEKQLKEIEGHGAKDKKHKAGLDTTNAELKAEADLSEALYEQLRFRAEQRARVQQGIFENEASSLQARVEANGKYTFDLLQMASLEAAKEQEIIQQKLAKIEEIEGISASKRTAAEKGLLLSKEAYQAQLVTATEKAEAKRIDIIEDSVKRERKLYEDANAARAASTKAYVDGYIKQTEEGFKRQQQNNKTEKERQAGQLSDLEIYTAKALELARQIGNIFASLSNARIQQYEQEINLINLRKDAEIAAINAAGLSDEDRLNKISELENQNLQRQLDLQEKIKQEKQKQAAFDRALTIAGIIRETAFAVTEALPNLPLAALVGAIGAAQLANVLATPLPQFAKGTDSSPEGWAIVGEKGPELRINPDGSTSLTPGVATQTYLQKGTQIIPNHEVKALAWQMAGIPQPMRRSSALDDAGLEKLGGKLDRVVAAIKGIPSDTLSITGAGLTHMTKVGSNRIERLRYLKN